MIRALLVALLGFASMGDARAHAGFENTTDVRLFSDRMEVVVRVSYALAWRLLGDQAPASDDETGKALAKPLLLAMAPELFEITQAGVPMMPRKVNCAFELNKDVAFVMVYEQPSQWPLVVKARFFKSLGTLDSGTISLFDQSAAPFSHDTEPIVGKVLMAGDVEFSFSPAPLVTSIPGASPSVESPATAAPSFGRYFLFGIRHILGGYDHLLFLLVLLLACRSLRLMLWIITAFTVAHSVTLALAALDVVNLPSRWVESFIALSIIYVGVENIGWKVVDKRRVGLTFAFGLVHGLGFASVLKGIGLGVGGRSIIPPVLAFNLGVEAGQVAVVLVTLPVLFYLRRFERFSRYGTAALSLVVVAIGAVWFVQRVFAV